MTTIELPGLRTRPLASYLSALGLLRVVGTQLDPDARGRWTHGAFVLDTDASMHDIETFLLGAYRPSPLVAPWNDKDQGGFEPGSTSRAARLVGWVEASTSDRLAGYRQTIDATRAIVETPAWQEAHRAKDKATMVMALRNGVPDDAVSFLDAAVALTAEGLAFPPILGTGGNVGRLNLVTNFVEHLEAVLEPKRPDDPRRWLDEVSTGTPTSGVGATPGQFDYHGAGGVNQGRATEGRERVNPWTYLLTIEGALTFAATATRRLGSHRAQASAPFTVSVSAAGYPSATGGEASKGELWVPVWDAPWSMAEVQAVFAEGRATWGGQQARNGTDFLRAVRSLGVDRGITGFERFAFLERHGQSPQAVFAGRIEIRSELRVLLTAELDRWISSLNRGGDDRTPAAVRSARNQVNQALFAVADRPDPLRLRALLLAVAQAERAVSRSSSAKAAGVGPAPVLSTQWVAAMSDTSREFASPEFAIAHLLAAGRDSGRHRTAGDATPRSLRELVRPIVVAPSGRIAGFRPNGAVVAGLGSRPIAAVLADVAVARARSAPAPPDTADPPVKGIRLQFPVYRAEEGDPRVPGSVVEAFAAGDLNDLEIGRWLEALLLLDPHDIGTGTESPRVAHGTAVPLWRLLAPWFGQATLRPRTAPTGPDQAEAVALRSLVPVVRESWPTRLRHAREPQLGAVCREVRSAYAAAGLTAAFSPEAIARSSDLARLANPGHGDQLLAALMVPTRLRDLAALATTHLRIDQGVSP